MSASAAMIPASIPGHRTVLQKIVEPFFSSSSCIQGSGQSACFSSWFSPPLSGIPPVLLLFRKRRTDRSPLFSSGRTIPPAIPLRGCTPARFLPGWEGLLGLVDQALRMFVSMRLLASTRCVTCPKGNVFSRMPEYYSCTKRGSAPRPVYSGQNRCLQAARPHRWYGLLFPGQEYPSDQQG